MFIKGAVNILTICHLLLHEVSCTFITWLVCPTGSSRDWGFVCCLFIAKDGSSWHSCRQRIGQPLECSTRHGQTAFCFGKISYSCLWWRFVAYIFMRPGVNLFSWIVLYFFGVCNLLTLPFCDISSLQNSSVQNFSTCFRSLYTCLLSVYHGFLPRLLLLPILDKMARDGRSVMYKFPDLIEQWYCSQLWHASKLTKCRVLMWIYFGIKCHSSFCSIEYQQSRHMYVFTFNGYCVTVKYSSEAQSWLQMYETRQIAC